jgi:putative flippase GtrA
MMRKELGRFLIVGSITVAIDLASYRLLLLLGVDISIAKGLGFAIGTVFAYFANRLWTFTAEGGYRRFLVFCALYLTTLAINVGANDLVVWLLGRDELALAAAFLVATGISATLNFMGMKFLVFAAVSQTPTGGDR